MLSPDVMLIQYLGLTGGATQMQYKSCTLTGEYLLPIEANARKIRMHYVEQLLRNGWSRPALLYQIAVDARHWLAVVPIAGGRVVE